MNKKNMIFIKTMSEWKHFVNQYADKAEKEHSNIQVGKMSNNPKQVLNYILKNNPKIVVISDNLIASLRK